MFIMTAGMMMVMLWAVMIMFAAGRVLAAGAVVMRRLITVLWMPSDVCKEVTFVQFIWPCRICIGRYLKFLVLMLVIVIGKHRMFSAVFDSQCRISFYKQEQIKYNKHRLMNETKVPQKNIKFHKHACFVTISESSQTNSEQHLWKKLGV